MGRVYLLNHSGKPCSLQGRTAGSQGNLDKSKLRQCMHQMWERSTRLKTPECKKLPIKSVALAEQKRQHQNQKTLQKKQQRKTDRLELRASGDLQAPEKPGWSADDMGKVAQKSKINNMNEQ